MRLMVVVALIVGSIGGLLGSLAFGQVSGPAGAAPPAQSVREQNLDGSGLIRVHEQGTANVNVTNGSLPVSATVNVGNLPSVQDVNVVAIPEPPLVERVYVFAQNDTANEAGGHFLSDALDTQGCRKLEVFLRFASSNVDAYNLVVWESTDGVNRLLLTRKGGFQGLGNLIASWGSSTIANWVFVEVRNLGGQVLEEGILHCVSE